MSGFAGINVARHVPTLRCGMFPHAGGFNGTQITLMLRMAADFIFAMRSI